MHRARATLLLTITVNCASQLVAQWPNDPGTNLPIGDGTGDQTLAKVATTADGGCYVGWFDNRSGSYAVYLQRLDAEGNELWPHGGMLVSGNAQSSSLVDWDLIRDSQDSCVLTFTDTRAGGDLDVYAYRIATNGTFQWGPNGVALSNNGDFEPNPRVVESDNGDFVFTWANTGTSTLQLQRLDAAGVPRYSGDGIAIPGDPGAVPGFVQIAAGTGGDVVLSWVRTIAFSGNKHIHAQKYDALGNPLWNAGTRLPVFDQGSVPIAHQPKLLGDGLGGAVFAWHFPVGNLFSVRVQHVQPNGVETFAHDGVDVSTSANSKFDPAIVWRSGVDELLVVWNERNLAQTTWGLFAQKFDAVGVRQWGAGGVQLLPIDTVVKFAPVAAPLGDGMATAVLVESLGNQLKEVVLFGIDNGGALRWTPQTTASNVPSDKLRLAIATTRSGSSLLAWTDHRNGTADVHGQAVGLDGGVGLTMGRALVYGCGTNPAGSLVATGTPAFGQATQIELSNPLATQPAGSLGFLFFGTQPAPGFPCGVLVPGFGMAGPGQPGEVLIEPNAPNTGVFLGVWSGAPNVLTTFFTTPFSGGLLGQSLYAQGLMIDLAPGASLVFGLSTALQLQVGS